MLRKSAALAAELHSARRGTDFLKWGAKSMQKRCKNPCISGISWQPNLCRRLDARDSGFPGSGAPPPVRRRKITAPPRRGPRARARPAPRGRGEKMSRGRALRTPPLQSECKTYTTNTAMSKLCNKQNQCSRTSRGIINRSCFITDHEFHH